MFIVSCMFDTGLDPYCECCLENKIYMAFIPSSTDILKVSKYTTIKIRTIVLIKIIQHYRILTNFVLSLCER